MLAKLKQINLTVGITRKVADIVVAISVPIKGVAPCCLNRLKTNCGSAEPLMPGSEESALVYALYEAVRDKLSGSGLEVLKSKASNVKCSYTNDHFTISFHTAGTGTALRKASGLALSCYNPAKLFSKYSENIRFLTGKGGNREEFNFVAKKLVEGIHKSIAITAVGKINVDEKKMVDIVKVLVGKLPDIDMSALKPAIQPAKKKPEVEDKPYPIIKCDGLTAAVVSDYIRNNSNGMSVDITNEGVVVYNHLWESKHKQLKDKKRINEYIAKKYGKLDVELASVFTYFALSEEFVDATIAAKVVSSKLKTSNMTEVLHKVM